MKMMRKTSSTTSMLLIIPLQIFSSLMAESGLMKVTLLVDNEVAREFDFLRLMFPMRFFNDVIIPLTNAKLNQL